MVKEVGGARTTLADLDERQLWGPFWTDLSRDSFDRALSFGNVRLGATGSIQRTRTEFSELRRAGVTCRST
jgi:hypothetical protein